MELNIENLLSIIYKNQDYVKLKDPNDIIKYVGYSVRYVGYSEAFKNEWLSVVPIVEIAYDFDEENYYYITISITSPWLSLNNELDEEVYIIKGMLLRILLESKIPGEIISERIDEHTVLIKYGIEE